MVTEYFFNFSYLFVWKNGNFFFHQGKIFFQVEIFFFQSGKLFFPIFPSATLLMDNEISNQNNLLGLRKDRKQLEKVQYWPDGLKVPFLAAQRISLHIPNSTYQHLQTSISICLIVWSLGFLAGSKAEKIRTCFLAKSRNGNLFLFFIRGQYFRTVSDLLLWWCTILFQQKYGGQRL